MQHAAAALAAAGARLKRQLFIDAQKERMKLGAQQRRVAHWRGLSRLGKLRDNLPSLGDRISKIPEGDLP